MFTTPENISAVFCDVLYDLAEHTTANYSIIYLHWIIHFIVYIVSFIIFFIQKKKNVFLK